MTFTTGHKEAIMALGAQNPSQHWAMLDVSMDLARRRQLKTNPTRHGRKA